MLPPKPRNVVFRISIDGKISRIGFNNPHEAEWAAMRFLRTAHEIQIIDGVTGEVVKHLQISQPEGPVSLSSARSAGRN